MQKEFPKNNINRKVLYLVLWIIFFCILAFIITIPARKEEKNPQNNNVVTNTQNEDEFEIPSTNKKLERFNSLKNVLLNRIFDFKYTYSGPEGIVIYSGDMNKNIMNVTVENKDGISKYYVENDIVYITKLDEKVVTDYDIDHKSYLDVDYLFESVLEDDIIYNENEIDFSLPDGYGKIFIDKEVISKIEVYVDITTYTLEFSNIK